MIVKLWRLSELILDKGDANHHPWDRFDILLSQNIQRPSAGQAGFTLLLRTIKHIY